MKLTQKFIDALKTEMVKMEIGVKAGVKFSTLGRYVRENDEKLLLPRIKNAITEVTGLVEDDFFESQLHSISNN
jgi:hypothetical protein